MDITVAEGKEAIVYWQLGEWMTGITNEDGKREPRAVGKKYYVVERVDADLDDPFWVYDNEGEAMNHFKRLERH